MAKNKEESQVTFSDEQIKHLEFIQDVITRMNNNSFQMKGWMLAIVSALLGFYADSGNTRFAAVAILPIITFWLLDTYYLWQERKFRGLYKDVAKITSHNEIKPFAMRPDLYTEGEYSFWDVLTSVTILPLYDLMIVLLGIISIFF